MRGRSVGFADIVIPASAAAGHRPTAAIGQVVKARDQQLQSQTDYLNSQILAAIVLLAPIAVVYTLVTTMLSTRRA